MVEGLNFVLFEPTDPAYFNVDCSLGSEFFERFARFAIDLNNKVIELTPGIDGRCHRLARPQL